MKHTVETDVLVVGGGPVGLALAGDLGWRGIRAVLVERSDGAIYQPKMDGVNVRTMEFCRRWGITETVRNCGYPKEFPQDMVYLTSFGGFELGREEFITPSGGGEERRSGASPETRFRCPQNLFDPILREFAGSYASVDLRYLTRIAEVNEEDDRVVSVVESQDGTRTEIVSRYVAGCDGASSKVRGKLGIGMSGLGTLTYTTNVMFRCAALREKSRVRLGYRHLLIGPEGTWGTIVAINGRDEWRLSLVGIKEKVEFTDQDVRAAIERAIGLPLDYEVMSVVPWVRKELVADTYGTRRIFLAGDSAHITSPTGGFGMNMGIADAVDLSWKIEAVLRGWGGPQLLPSYEIERRPVALRAVREASGNLLRTTSAPPTPQLLDATYEGALARYAVGTTFSATMLREWYKLGIDLGYVYADSPVVVPDRDVFPAPSLEAAPKLDAPEGYLADGTRITPSLLREWQRLSMHLALGADVKASWQELNARDVMLYRPTAGPGARAPHVGLDDGRSTLDWFGRGFTLVCTSSDQSTAVALKSGAERRGVPLHVEHSAEHAVRLAYAAPHVLVRPDGHVAWRGRSLSGDEAVRVIDRVRGAEQR